MKIAVEKHDAHWRETRLLTRASPDQALCGAGQRTQESLESVQQKQCLQDTSQRRVVFLPHPAEKSALEWRKILHITLRASKKGFGVETTLVSGELQCAVWPSLRLLLAS